MLTEHKIMILILMTFEIIMLKQMNLMIMVMQVMVQNLDLFHVILMVHVLTSQEIIH